MTEWKTYEELTAEQQEQVKDRMRLIWLEDAKLEAGDFGRDETLDYYITELQEKESGLRFIENYMKDMGEDISICEIFRQAMREIGRG